MKLGIIVGATRQGRQSDKMAKWVLNGAHKLDGVEAELVDLRDYPMPFFDEPISPRYNQDRQVDPAVEPWLKKLESFDAYVFVTPEYNHAIPGVLKNALDFVTWELLRKPAAVVSHGSAGGARAQLNLKVILSESRAVPIPMPSPLAMSGMSELIDENGVLTEAAMARPYDLNEILTAMLTDLQWYSDALAQARSSQP